MDGWIALPSSLRDFAVRGFSFLGLASQASGCRRVATENTSQCSVEEKFETAIFRTAQAEPPRQCVPRREPRNEDSRDSGQREVSYFSARLPLRAAMV